jgi:transposase InsO family protein
MPEVISCDLAADDHAELFAQIEKPRHRTAPLGAVVALLVAVLRASKVQLDYERLPEGDAKRILLRAIERARKVLPLNTALRITRLSPSRYHGWCRLVRSPGWRRPRVRVYPAKPKVGIRAKAPGELLHLDVTIIRLLDGTRAYLHGVIDNYSRRILSWSLEERLGSGGTCRILREAVVELNDCPDHAIVVADSGSENVNGAVDELLDGEEWTRVLAQVEITFSNSMIEAFWRSLKHSWLYLHSLDSFAALRRLIEFYVEAHNEAMPHSAFHGQTPNEVFFGIGEIVIKELAGARKTAREKRMEANRAATCGVCVGEVSCGALLLQRARSRMS